MRRCSSGGRDMNVVLGELGGMAMAEEEGGYW
jgi:hypothetical protein